MISDKAKKSIDSMTLEDMAYEVNRGHASRFQRDNFAYLKTCYESRLREEELKNSISKNQSSNEAKNKPKTVHNPRLYRIMEGVIAGVLILCVAWSIKHYFSIEL